MSESSPLCLLLLAPPAGNHICSCVNLRGGEEQPVTGHGLCLGYLGPSVMKPFLSSSGATSPSPLLGRGALFWKKKNYKERKEEGKGGRGLRR